MSTYQISVSSRIPASAERVYSIVADYRAGHPHILPPRFFGGLEVERGGVGAGTVIRVQVTLFGRVQHFRAEIAEPRPGRVLTETNLGSGEMTTFEVAPAGGGCEVTISTVAPARPGLSGRIEAWLSARFLRGVYRLELEMLEQAAANPAVRPGTS
ncbi:MAG: SRPBCC family protein [Gemmatimonadetes bacterium]|nr:SRPBCC family protein [Gemmatimonadota bacterium]